jgi:Glyoxalase/Bleomycin resistance protein/Dioxygenase superfamily
VQYLRRVEVKGIHWLGVGTERVSQLRSFAIEVLGMRVDGQDTDHFVELAMGDGARLEIFGPAATADSPWQFESNPVVAGFLVDDIEAARDELSRTPNTELLGELQTLPSGYAWQHFRAPDGNVYELTSDPAAAS